MKASTWWRAICYCLLFLCCCSFIVRLYTFQNRWVLPYFFLNKKWVGCWCWWNLVKYFFPRWDKTVWSTAFGAAECLCNIWRRSSPGNIVPQMSSLLLEKHPPPQPTPQLYFTYPPSNWSLGRLQRLPTPAGIYWKIILYSVAKLCIFILICYFMFFLFNNLKEKNIQKSNRIKTRVFLLQFCNIKL